MHILFLTHDSGRTGAPMALLHFMRWLKKHTSISFSILLRIHGDLEQDMKDIAPVYMYDNLLQNPLLAKKIINNVSVVYGNTVGIHDMLSKLPLGKVPILIHVHELEHMIQYFHGQTVWQSHNITHYIAVSHAVKQNLLATHHIPEERISMIYESIAIPDIEAILSRSAPIRTHLGIAPQDYIVGGCGSVTWRKGPDLFIDVASHFQKMNSGTKVHFIWLGAPFDTAHIEQLRYDIKKRKLEDTVQFIGPRLNQLDYMGLFDIFLMTSREDPFPLVVLEAGSLKKPIICFADAGGSPEFVASDTGYVIPYGDTQAVAERVNKLIDDPLLRNKLGNNARHKFLQSFTIETCAPRILDVLQTITL